MSVPKTQTELNIYEIDGKETEGRTLPRLIVRSHWNRGAWVVLDVPGAKPITVYACKLQRAIQNCS